VSGFVSTVEPTVKTCEGVWSGWSAKEHDGEPTLLVDGELRPALPVPLRRSAAVRAQRDQQDRLDPLGRARQLAMRDDAAVLHVE
jgi:hypothetical protein